MSGVVLLLAMALYGWFIYGQCRYCETPLTVWWSVTAVRVPTSPFKRVPARLSMTWGIHSMRCGGDPDNAR